MLDDAARRRLPRRDDRVHDRSSIGAPRTATHAVPGEGHWELARLLAVPGRRRARAIPIGRIRRDPAGPRYALGVHGRRRRHAGRGRRGAHVVEALAARARCGTCTRCGRSCRRPVGPQILAGDFNFWGPPRRDCSCRAGERAGARAHVPRAPTAQPDRPHPRARRHRRSRGRGARPRRRRITARSGPGCGCNRPQRR